MVKSKYKDKNQTIIEFFESLQNEYVVAELRSKIYPKQKDKKYWRDRVMKGKKDTIQQIAERNNLPTIFNDQRVRDTVYFNIYDISGFPKFVYKNDEEKRELQDRDFWNYYMKNAEFKIDQSGTIGYLNEVDRDIEIAELKLKDTGEMLEKKLSEIARIL